MEVDLKNIRGHFSAHGVKHIITRTGRPISVLGLYFFEKKQAYAYIFSTHSVLGYAYRRTELYVEFGSARAKVIIVLTLTPIPPQTFATAEPRYGGSDRLPDVGGA